MPGEVVEESERDKLQRLNAVQLKLPDVIVQFLCYKRCAREIIRSHSSSLNSWTALVLEWLDCIVESYRLDQGIDLEARSLFTYFFQLLSTRSTIRLTIIASFMRFEVGERFRWADTFSSTTVDAYPSWVRRQALDHCLLVLPLILCPVPARLTCTDPPRLLCLIIRIRI